MKNFLLVLIVLLFLGVVGGTMAFLYQQSQPPPTAYQTVTVVRRTIVDKAIATGSIVPRKEIAIKPQVRGVLDALFVKPGQQVKAGDRLARIKIIADPLEVNLAQYELKKAQLELSGTAEALRITQELAKKGSSNVSELNERQLQYDIAKAHVRSAQSHLELISAGVTKSAGPTATLVEATIDGTVLDRPVEEGNFVIESSSFNQGTTIVTIADMRSLLFKGMVTEIEAGRLYEGMSLAVTIGALASEQFAATLEFVSPKANTQDGSVKFEINAALHVEPAQVLRAGYSATAEIVFSRYEDVLAIPERGLVFRAGKVFVMLEAIPGPPESREVRTGISDGMYIEITSDNLHVGDRIVISSGS